MVASTVAAAIPADDGPHMDRALALAERGRGSTSPNPMVGAVIVASDGAVAGAGYHRRAGEPHAEIHALRAAGPLAAGATLYCTLEPCCHTGRTGPCAPAVAAAGIERVVIAVEDPNPLVAGGGIRYLLEHGVRVEVGLRRAEARRLNAGFFTFVRERRPFVIMKVATSLDGRIAAGPGRRTVLTSPPADRRVHLLRAEIDGIGIGSGTLLCDDPLLTVRGVHRERPLVRAIFDRRLRTRATARVFGTLDTGPVVVLTTERSAAEHPDRVRRLESAGAQVVGTAGGSPGEALAALAGRGVTSILMEGGVALHRAIWQAGLVDRVQIYVAPVVLGEAGVPWLDHHTLGLAGRPGVSVRQIGCDSVFEFDVHGTD